MKAMASIIEQKQLLAQGYYLFHRKGNRILWLSSLLQWEVYATFETEKEAEKALEYIIYSYEECLECELDPWCVKRKPEYERGDD